MVANTKTLVRYYPQKKKSSRRTMRKIPILPALALGYVAVGTVQRIKTVGLAQSMKDTLYNFTGVQDDGGWGTGGFKYGLYPVLGGFVGHWVAGKLGINRTLGRMKLPFVL